MQISSVMLLINQCFLLIQNEYGDSALFGACRGRHAEIARILLDLGTSIDLQNEVSH